MGGSNCKNNLTRPFVRPIAWQIFYRRANHRHAPRMLDVCFHRRPAKYACTQALFRRYVFSSAGFDDQVVSDWSEAETGLRRTVIEQSAKKYFLADHSKRDKRYTHIVCHVHELDNIICEETDA